MVNIKNILREFGLNEKEILLYEILLSFRQATVSTLARKSSIPRSTAGYHCRNLLEKGFFHCIEMNGVPYYSIVDAAVVSADMKRQKQELEKKEKMAEVLQEMIQKQKLKHAVLPKIREFHGPDGIMAMLDDVLAYQGPIYGCFNMDMETDTLLLDYVKNVYIPARQKNKNPAFSLFADTEATRKYQKTDSLLRRTSLLIPAEYLPFEACLYLFGDKAAFHSAIKGEQMALVIESRPFIKTLKSMFALAWDKAILCEENKIYNEMNSKNIGLYSVKV